MIIQETYTLNNGVKIPKVGFGTWMIDNEKVVGAVNDALEIGYRHIDTAQAYKNEAGVGKAIKDSLINRSDIFLTSKVAAEHKSYQAAAKSIDESLERLGLDYIDLMLIHAPQPWSEFRKANYDTENIEVWRALEDAFKAGKVRSIGVSNFNQHDIKNILNNSQINPAVNQVLAHISNTPFDLVDFCKQKDILVEAYSPVGHGELLKNSQLAKLAKKYKVSIAQLAIKYCLQLGLLPLPKASTESHIKENSTLSFEISQDDMNALESIGKIEDYGDSKKFPVYKEN